jgi:predicted aminopeptidase
MRAAYEQASILLSRTPNEEVISDTTATDRERAALQLVNQVRAYGASRGLTPGDSYTTYARVDRDILSWIVVGSKKTSFETKQWWFPIVGSVPYKGFFEREDAEAVGRTLMSEGYEVSIRGTDAYSTLGWFDDPVLSTMIRYSDARLAATIFHESLHATVWVPDHVQFNESLAQFFGLEAAVEFFEHAVKQCPADHQECIVTAQKNHNEALNNRANDYIFAEEITKLYQDLESLYNLKLNEQETLSRKQALCETHEHALATSAPQLKGKIRCNNADIMQTILYTKEYHLFKKLYESQSRSWGAFFAALLTVKERASEGEEPFAIVERLALKQRLPK